MSVLSPDTAPVRPGEELDWSKLESYLRDHLPRLLPDRERQAVAAAPRMEVEQFPGGHSNLTYLLRFGDGEFVLRRPPFGPVAPTAHDMAREYRVLSMLNPVFALAPRPFLLCQETDVIGAPFYVMERRRGLVIRRRVPPEVDEDMELRRRISRAIVDTLTALHSIDIEETGLVQLGKPAGFVERQIKGWAGRWERAKTGEVPQIDAVIDWLIKRIPTEPLPATLVHNDYKLDNVMLDGQEPSRVIAVLDWEMCTVGDPLVDLGLLLCYWPEAGDPEPWRDSISPVTTLPGWYSRAQIIERYAAQTGRDLSNISFYLVFALFKVAVVLQQIFFRYKRGQTHDERFADFDRRVLGLAEAALEQTRSPSF